MALIAHLSATSSIFQSTMVCSRQQCRCGSCSPTPAATGLPADSEAGEGRVVELRIPDAETRPKGIPVPPIGSRTSDNNGFCLPSSPQSPASNSSTANATGRKRRPSLFDKDADYEDQPQHQRPRLSTDVRRAIGTGTLPRGVESSDQNQKLQASPASVGASADLQAAQTHMQRDEALNRAIAAEAQAAHLRRQLDQLLADLAVARRALRRQEWLLSAVRTAAEVSLIWRGGQTPEYGYLRLICEVLRRLR